MINSLFFYTSKYYYKIFQNNWHYCYYIFNVLNDFYIKNIILTIFISKFTKDEINNIDILFKLYSKNGVYNFNYFIYMHIINFLNLCLTNDLFNKLHIDILYCKIGNSSIKFSNLNFIKNDFWNCYYVDFNHIFKSNLKNNEYIIID